MISAGNKVSFGFCGAATGSDYSPQLVSLSVEGGSSSSTSSSSSSTSSTTSSSSSTGSSSTSSNSTSNSSSSSSSSTSSSSSSGAHQYPPITQGCNGYATRFWDCCKPHCSWSGNLPSGVNTLPSCAINDQPLADINAASACEGGSAHTCSGLVPFAVDDQLAFGYAATSSGDVCGRC
ncbi:MAG: endoglucanase, partial [Cellvibrionaceae bacterium]|nr:endoglucanase [Cellvibrionaceae bacterium]